MQPDAANFWAIALLWNAEGPDHMPCGVIGIKALISAQVRAYVETGGLIPGVIRRGERDSGEETRGEDAALWFLAV
jgi:hypothetical protein